MSSRFFAFGLLLALAACGGSGNSLRNLDDACSISRERPTYLRAMERTQSRWGIPVSVQMATIWQESKFRSDARTPIQYAVGVIPMGRQSSAYGYAQALDATWDEYKSDVGNWGARRDDIRDATDFIGWYMNQSHQRLGISKADAKNQYLAFHEGQTGFARGSYKRKGWLVTISNTVAARARTYDQQLRGCGLV